MEKPTILYNNYIHDNKSFDGAVKASFDLYMRKYLKEAEKPKEKFIGPLFQSGKIYAFTYATPDKPSPERPVIDRRPLFLSIGQVQAHNKVLEVGIDLNMIPPQARKFIFECMFKYFNSPISDNMKSLNEGKKSGKSLNLSWMNANKVFKGTGWQTAFMACDRANIKNTKVVDYEDWTAMMFANTKSLEGLSLSEVYNIYIKKLSKPDNISI